METVIKLRPEELNLELVEKIKQLIGETKHVELTISISDQNSTYLASLDQSIQQLSNNDTVTFTMEDFLEYSGKK